MDHRRTVLLPSFVAGPVCASLVCAGLMPGCAAKTSQPRDDAPSAALEDLGSPAPTAQASDPGRRSLAEAARQSAQDLEVLMNLRAEDRTALTDAAQDDAAQDPAPIGAQRPWQRQAAPPAAGTQAEQAADALPTPVAQDEDRPSDASTAERDAPPPDPIALVLARLERDSTDPKRALAATMLAHAVRTYSGRDDGSRPGQQLSPPERELVERLGPVLEALAAGDRADAPERIGQAIDLAARDLAAVLPVRINDAALATDIYGFAAYRPFESYAFLAGRQNRVLLYTEPASFESRPTADPASRGEAANPGAYEVQLGLELRLFNERGSMLAWRRPEERVAIRSDRPRSEVYLGTMIDLPASLTVGRYQLKVILRDLANGSEDERVIPIEIVADPRLTVRSTRDR